MGPGNIRDEEEKILGRKVLRTGNKKLYKKMNADESEEEKKDSDSNYMSAALDENGVLWIAWYHPANSYGKWSESIIEDISEFIHEAL